MTRSLSRTLTVLTVATLLLASACGAAHPPTAAQDKAAAERIVLTSVDLPGFTAVPVDDDDSSSSLDACLNGNRVLLGDNDARTADGLAFVQDDGDVRVQSSVFVAPTGADARQAFTDIRNALSSRCFTDDLRAALQEDADSGLVVRAITSTPLPTLAVADEFAAARLTVPLEIGGERQTVFFDMTFLRQGRMLAGMFTFQAGSPFPDSERSRLSTLVGERLRGKAKNTPDTALAPTTSTTATTATTSTTATTATTAVRMPTTTAGPTGEQVRFRDSASGVSLEHPRTWTVEPSGDGRPLVVFLDPATGVPFRRNVNFFLESGARPITLDEYTQFSLKQVNELKGVTIGESRPTTLSGSPAYRLSYRADLGHGDLRFLAVWTVRNGRVWLVTFTSDPARYNTSLPEIERLLTTIQLPA